MRPFWFQPVFDSGGRARTLPSTATGSDSAGMPIRLRTEKK
jgi:hypothetical protein